MANTRFKTENGLLVTGGNAHFQNEVNMYANLVVDADLVLVRGDLQVQGTQVFTGGQQYDSDIVATTDGLNLGNTTNQFNAFLGTVRVFDGLFPQGNTLPLGNSTNRWVITANTLNLSGSATIGGTLDVTGLSTFSNAIVLNDQAVLPVTAGAQVVLRSGKAHASSAEYYGLYNQAKITNAAMISTRNHSGVRSELVNESRNLSSDGLTQYNVNYYGYSAIVYNGNSAIGGNARANELFGVQAVLANYANGSLANTVTRSNAGQFNYESRGSGVTTSSYGVTSTIKAANNSVTGNITTAYGVFTRIESNTAMNIGTGYLYYGDHNGTTTTDKYGLYLTGEGNNYLSGELNVVGKIVTSNTLAVTGNTNLSNTLAVTGNVRFSNTLNVTGNVSLSNTLAVTGNVTFSNTLAVTGNVTFSNNLTVTGRVHTIAGNTNFATSTLVVDSAASSVGIGTSTPDAKLQVVGTANIGGNMRLASDLNVVGSATVGGTFRVTGAANAIGTFGITGAANAMGTLGITGAANAMGTLGVGGLLTAAAGLTVTGITNTSTAFNVSGGVATTNGASINTTSIAVGNTTSYTNIQPIKITTFIPAVSQEAQIAYANSTGSLWFYQAYAHRATDSWSLNRADGTSYLSTMMAAYRSNNSLLFNANAHVFVGNANFAAINATSVNATSINAVSVNAASHTVGSALIANSTGVYHTGVINATSVNAASYTIGSTFIANTAGITHSGYANIAGTLEADGSVVFANTNNRAVVIGAETFGSGVSGNNLISAGRTYTGAESSHVMYKSISIANAALTSGSVSHLGDRVFIENKSLTRTDAGATTSSALYGYYADVINGTGNSSINTLYGSAAILQNQANGTFANSVTTAMSGYFLYRSSGSGTTGTAYGVQGRIDAANNAVTGNITTAISVVSTIESNTAMTIGTGILYYGAHAGSKTTDKYGLYILNESNNYVSGDFYVGGDSLKIPTGTQSDRPTAAAGLIRLNTTSASFEGHNGSTWIPLGSGAVNLGGGSISGLSYTSIAVPSTIRVIHLSGYLYNLNSGVSTFIPRSWIRLATSSTILTSGYVNSRDEGTFGANQNIYFPISEFYDNNYSKPLFFNSILTYDAQGYWHISTHATTCEHQSFSQPFGGTSWTEVPVDYHNHGIIACNPLATIYIYRNTGTWPSGSWVRAYGLTST